MSISERIQLVEDIRDSIAKAPDSIPLSREQKSELDKRLDVYYSDPGRGASWDIVRG